MCSSLIPTLPLQLDCIAVLTLCSVPEVTWRIIWGRVCLAHTMRLENRWRSGERWRPHPRDEELSGGMVMAVACVCMSVAWGHYRLKGASGWVWWNMEGALVSSLAESAVRSSATHHITSLMSRSLMLSQRASDLSLSQSSNSTGGDNSRWYKKPTCSALRDWS